MHVRCIYTARTRLKIETFIGKQAISAYFIRVNIILFVVYTESQLVYRLTIVYINYIHYIILHREIKKPRLIENYIPA